MFDVAALLGLLVDKSLVAAGPTGSARRYRLLEAIRRYRRRTARQAGDGKGRRNLLKHPGPNVDSGLLSAGSTRSRD